MKPYKALLILATTGICILGGSTPAALSASGSPVHKTVAASPVKEYYITCDPDSFATIYQNFKEDIYIPATITYLDKTWTDVQLRLRGDTSRELPKKSLKLKFEGEAFANGRDVLNFNAEYEDNSYIHSYISSTLFTQTGHPCFQTEYARIYLNGAFLGLYLNVENMDEAFLTSRGLDPNGNLYKATYDGACLSVQDNVNTHWEKKTNESSGREDLQELIQKINTVPDSAYYQFAHEVFDYDRMVNIIALNLLLANGSTYYHNYYMYHNPADGKWSMFPWDMDKTFTSYGTGYPFQRSTSWEADNPFLERAMMCAPIFEDIQQRIKELTQTFFSPDYLYPIIDNIKNVLAESIAQDTTDLNPNVDKWYVQLQRERDFIKDRYAALLDQFKNHPRTFRIPRTSGTMTPPLRLRWERSTDPNEDPITYTVRVSTEKYFPVEKTTAYENLTDTTLTIQTPSNEGQYYWTVAASDGTTSVDGFDKLNSFVYKQGSKIPYKVTGLMTLTLAGSPYSSDSDIIVEADGELRAEPGVEIIIPPTRSIVVYGKLDLRGSVEQPVSIHTIPNAEYWANIIFKAGSKPSTLSHVTLHHGTDPTKTSDYYIAKITGYESDITLDHVEFVNCYRGVLLQGGRLEMTNCRLTNGNCSELIRIWGGTAHIEGCTLANAKTVYPGPTADGIDLDSASSGLVKNNMISGMDDDGIDTDKTTATLEGNIVTNCADKGISLGTHSKITMARNTVFHCGSGVDIKDETEAIIDRLTTYNVARGCGVYRNSSANITNSIFSQSSSASVYAENDCTLNLRFSLSDTDELPGNNNLKANPLFVDAAQHNFHLQPASPCIDAGDPQGEPDPDNTRADLGAFYFNKTAATPNIVINEISYNQPDDMITGDWVELYNPDAEPVDVSGWVFKDESDDHVFTLPNGTFLAPHGYLVLCEDTTEFRQFFPDVHPVLGNTGFGLSGSGELVRLFNSSGDIVDSLTFDDNTPWPEEADGEGPTLELISASYDNALAQSWKASQNNGGTPGKRNSSTTDSVGDPQEEQLYFLHQNYPNPFSASSTIGYILLKPAHVTIEVFNALGQPVLTLFDADQGSGAFSIPFSASGLASGHYLYGLRINGTMVVVKSAIVIE